MSKKTPIHLPNALLAQAVLIDVLDEQILTWKADDVENVVHYLQAHNAAILGIRVFERVEDIFLPTDHEWTVERSEPDWDWQVFVQESTRGTLEFLRETRLGNEEGIFYALNFVDTEAWFIRTMLPKNTPDEFADNAYMINMPAYVHVAWKYEYAIKAVQYFANRHYCILGGDVYHIQQDGSLDPTLDSWFYNPSHHSSLEDIQSSKDTSLSYIEKFYHRNGDDYAYSLDMRLEIRE